VKSIEIAVDVPADLPGELGCATADTIARLRYCTTVLIRYGSEDGREWLGRRKSPHFPAAFPRESGVMTITVGEYIISGISLD